MFLGYYATVVVLCAAVTKGTTTFAPTTQSVTSPVASSTPNPSSDYTTSSVTTPPGVSTTTENATPAPTHSETTLSQLTPESGTTTTTLSTTVAETSGITTSSPTESPSASTSGVTTATATQETSQPTSTMTGLTTETTPPTHSTEASDSTTILPTTITTPISNTATPTTNTDTTVAVTTMQPTEMTTGNSTTTAAPPIPTAGPVIACPAVPCPLESVCLDGACQCLSGSFLLNGKCVPAQVFPGQLHLLSLTFQNEMRDRSSSVFQKTAAEISAALASALRDQPGYIRSDVVQLEPGSVQATVNNIFENTTATQESVDESIDRAIANSVPTGLLANATFRSTNLCEQEPLPCDAFTTMCTNTGGRPACSCKEGYISIVYSNTSCKACPSGQQAVGDTCQPCAFGYAGFNCNDSALLAVVVISCVLGGILLILVLALLIYCCWRRCSKSKPDFNSSPYSSGDINQPWPTGVTPIPRATTNWDTAPSIELTEGGSTRALVDKDLYGNGLGSQLKESRWKKTGSYDLNPEGMKTFNGKNTSRYSYLVQGHENPYFLPGDDKKN